MIVHYINSHPHSHTHTFSVLSNVDHYSRVFHMAVMEKSLPTSVLETPHLVTLHGSSTRQ